MRDVALLLACALSLWPDGTAWSKDATQAAINRAKTLAMRTLPPLPSPQRPREVFVPERKVWVPALGTFATVPGHWERRLSETQSSVPALTIFREDDRTPIIISPRERPPAETRSGP